MNLIVPPPRRGHTGLRGATSARSFRRGVEARARGLRSAAAALPDRLRGFFADLGPGLTSGAADDDPSGISTYSVTGAAFGYAPLWTALFSFPLMVGVQLMCARLGLVTGRGLAGVVRRRYSRRVLWSACALLAVANIFNIGADLGGMAEAGQEVEQERARGRRDVERPGASKEDLRRSNVDVTVGMFLSNFVMYFIILTTAATLHAQGITEVTSARQAAEALRPLAGDAAYWLFTLGIIGTGVLSVPVLAGSCAYAVAEAAAWRGSLDQRPKDARGFYAVVAVSMAIGLALDYAGYDAVAMLFWSAVVNGVLAPPLIVLIVLLTSDPAVMGPKRISPPWLRALGWTTATVMGLAAVAMLVTATE